MDCPWPHREPAGLSATDAGQTAKCVVQGCAAPVPPSMRVEVPKPVQPPLPSPARATRKPRHGLRPLFWTLVHRPSSLCFAENGWPRPTPQCQTSALLRMMSIQQRRPGAIMTTGHVPAAVRSGRAWAMALNCSALISSGSSSVTKPTHVPCSSVTGRLRGATTSLRSHRSPALSVSRGVLSAAATVQKRSAPLPIVRKRWRRALSRRNTEPVAYRNVGLMGR